MLPDVGTSRQAATKRYKALHAQAFCDDASKASYIRDLQSEVKVYVSLVQQLQSSNQVRVHSSRQGDPTLIVALPRRLTVKKRRLGCR